MATRVQIKATMLTLTPEIEEYINKKVAILEKHILPLDNDALVNIEVAHTSNHHQHGNFYKAEIRLRAKGKEYYAISEKSDLYSALDDVKDEMVRELTSSKDKEMTLLRKGGAKIKAIIKRLTWKNNG